MTRDECRDWVEIPVRWGEMDALGHVNNARYLTYFEIARVHMLERLESGVSWHEADHGPVLASVACNFRQPVSYPARLEIGSTVTKISRRSFRVEHAIFFASTDVLVADGHSAVVWVDRGAGRPVELPETLAKGLESLALVNQGEA